MEAILVPISLFAMIAALVIAPKYFRSRDRQRLLETLRVAYERGQPVPPEIISTLQVDEPIKQSSPDRDLRSGITMIAVALAFIAVAAAIVYAEGDEEAWIVAAFGAFPGFIGIGHIAFWFARRDRVDPIDR